DDEEGDDEEGDDEEGDDEEGDDEEGDDDRQQMEPDDGLTEEQRADYEARGRAVDAVAGISFIGRRLTFSVRDGLQVTPQGYRGSPIPGGFVAAEVYPLTLTDKKSKKPYYNIGLSAVFDQALSVKADFQQQGGQEVRVNGTQRRFGLGLVYRYNIGNNPLGPTLKGSVRYNRLKFELDDNAVVDVPDVDYTYLDPGVTIRYPFTRALAVSGEARFLLILDTGQMQDGDQYGTGRVTGFDSDLHVEYKIMSSILVRVGGRLALIGYAFRGAGTKANNQDGDLNTQDVAGARDIYYGGYVVAGYQF
ncbi:MAG: hypothetical protein MJE77_19490, partial [Proteobacteria bacterium]|nr:hypothetical protein [Pseudomonadota bacterium]